MKGFSSFRATLVRDKDFLPHLASPTASSVKRASVCVMVLPQPFHLQTGSFVIKISLIPITMFCQPPEPNDRSSHEQIAHKESRGHKIDVSKTPDIIDEGHYLWVGMDTWVLLAMGQPWIHSFFQLVRLRLRQNNKIVHRD